jgi:hypothetical protein
MINKSSAYVKPNKIQILINKVYKSFSYSHSLQLATEYYYNKLYLFTIEKISMDCFLISS